MSRLSNARTPLPDHGPLAGRVRAMCWIAVATWGGFAAMYAVMGRPRIATIDAIAAVATAVATWRLLRGRHPRVLAAGHANVGIASVCLASAAVVSGQDASMAIWYLTVMPILAAFVAGVRGAIVWTIIDATLIAAVHVSAIVAPVTAEFVPTRAEVAVSHITLLVLILIGGILYRQVNDEHVLELETRERVIAAQASAALRQAQQLAVARDQALAAVRAQSRFLANTSHELRTPLNGVVGLSRLLLDTEPTDEQAELIDIIHRSGRTLVGLIDDILDLSKIESGNMSLDLHPVDLWESIRETVALFRPEAEDKGLALDLTIDDDVPRYVTSDEMRLHQILVNLLSNAIKFTDAGRVSVALEYSDSGMLELTVSDTGIGISQDAQEDLFEPFTQADASTTRRFGGTGLGLAIVRQLAELMQGGATVDSAPGVGASFRVTIRAAPLSELSSRDVRSVTTNAGLGLPDSAPMRVLVAEDNPTNVLVIERMLSRLGHSSEVVGNGLEAVEAAVNGQYDAILMDVHMPLLDGVEATRRIRAASGVSQPHIVALTASVFPAQRIRCEEAGMDDFLAKPVDVEALVAALQRAPMSCASHPIVPPVDPLAQLRMLLDDDDELADMVRRHLSNSKDLVAEIVAAIGDSEDDRVVLAAHSLKSSSAQFGSRALSALCAQIETRWACGDTHGSAEVVERLESVYEQAHARLSRTIARTAA
jgi:signal transduction histidine kinase/CheY-like chemotaxis protein/HPt (histidine-containing phosphotransfer) domain-containing protein